MKRLTFIAFSVHAFSGELRAISDGLPVILCCNKNIKINKTYFFFQYCRRKSSEYAYVILYENYIDFYCRSIDAVAACMYIHTYNVEEQ